MLFSMWVRNALLWLSTVAVSLLIILQRDEGNLVALSGWVLRDYNGCWRNGPLFALAMT